MSAVFYTFVGPGEQYERKNRALYESELGQAIRKQYPWIFIKSGGDRLSFDGNEIMLPNPDGYANLGYKMLAMLQHFIYSPHDRLFRIDDDANIDPKRLGDVVLSCYDWDYTGVDWWNYYAINTDEVIDMITSRSPGMPREEVHRRMTIYDEPGRNPVLYAIGAFMTLSKEAASRVYPQVLKHHENVILDDMMLGIAFQDTDQEGLKIGRNEIIQEYVSREVTR